MSVFSRMLEERFESLHYLTDASTGLRALVAKDRERAEAARRAVEGALASLPKDHASRAELEKAGRELRSLLADYKV